MGRRTSGLVMVGILISPAFETTTRLRPKITSLFNPRVLIALSLCFVGALVGTSSFAGAPPIETDTSSSLRGLYEDWLRAYERRDLTQTLAIFAPDYVSTFAGTADSGFDAARRSYESAFANGNVGRKWVLAGDMEVDVSGDLAYALADWQLVENLNGTPTIKVTNRSIDVLARRGDGWRIIRSFTIPSDARPVKETCETELPKLPPEQFTGDAQALWQTLMRWRAAYNTRDLAGTLHPYDLAITGLYAGLSADDYARLESAYRKSFAQTDRERCIDFEPEEIITSPRLAFIRDHWTSTVIAAGVTTQRRSRGIEIWRKSGGGEWRLLHYLSYRVCE